MTQTPQEIALEFARVIGYAKPYKIPDSDAIVDERAAGNFHADSTDSVLKVAVEWCKKHGMRIVCLYPEEDDRYGCLIESIFEGIKASEQLADTLPQAIMLAIIEADKVLRGK